MALQPAACVEGGTVPTVSVVCFGYVSHGLFRCLRLTPYHEDLATLGPLLSPTAVTCVWRRAGSVREEAEQLERFKSNSPKVVVGRV